MADKKNVNLENNMLSDDELGMVSGGTADEEYNEFLEEQKTNKEFVHPKPHKSKE